MQTISRRKMFDAIVATAAAAGITLNAGAEVRADHAVAVAFGDEDYLVERKARLAKHTAHLDEQVASSRAYRIKRDAEMVILNHYTALASAAILDGQPASITMPREHYMLLQENDRIDFIPNAEATHMIPILRGVSVSVVG